MLQRLDLGRLEARGGVPGDGRHLPVLQLLGGLLDRLSLPLAVGVDVGVGEDPVEPRLEVGAVAVLVERGERLGKALLYEVFGVGAVAGHPQRRRVELVQIRQRVALEARSALLVGLGLRLGHRRGRLRLAGLGWDGREVVHRCPAYWRRRPAPTATGAPVRGNLSLGPRRGREFGGRHGGEHVSSQPRGYGLCSRPPVTSVHSSTAGRQRLASAVSNAQSLTTSTTASSAASRA